MVHSRLLTLLLGVVGLNAAFVIWSVIDRHASADEPALASPPTTPISSQAATATGAESSSQTQLSDDPRHPPSSTVQQLLDAVPTPDTLPDPLPGSTLEADPAFQKFRDDAAEQFPFLTNPSPSTVASPARRKDIRNNRCDDCVLLEQRLRAVGQLNAAAMGLAREAGERVAADDDATAQRLLDSVAELRTLAAELLLSDL